MAAINLDIGGNTSRLDRDIQKTVNKAYSINLKTKGEQPLGRITGKVNEFTKSLDASNARVIAFGASAGIIFGVQRAFDALVKSVIEVQKSLADINVILNASTQELGKFGGELFNIAKNTGQSFSAVASAATEFSRQGLGLEETLKRTNEALILSRLSGLDAAKSVDALTAAVNSFASQAVTASEIVNKFANVDAAFAVSSADLADAISRVGSSAAQSGVSLNELIAIVTSAQQTTARGGAVIGNSFKTIFTRLQRTKVISLLDSLGVETRDGSGQIKSTISLLEDLARVYDNLGTLQQAQVAEQVGGVFQINILKSALADLGKEYSVYSSALKVAGSSTDQAIRRNEELNKTYASQLNALQENARQLASSVGGRLLGPAFDRVVGGANELLGGVNESDGTGVGATLGKGIIDGLAQFIAGPGLALVGGVLIKLFKDLAKFATGSVQQLLGLNTAAAQQQNLQQSISQILAKNPQLIDLALKGEQGLNQAASVLLQNLRAQTVELEKQAVVASQISKTLFAGGVRVSGGIPVAPVGGRPVKPGKAAGYIPNFASDKLIEKYTAISLGATQSVRPHMSQGTIGGKKFVMNNQEIEFPGVGKNGDSMVIPKYGDGIQMAAKGFIPNFAPFSLSSLTTGQIARLKNGNFVSGPGGERLYAKNFGTTPEELKNNPRFLAPGEKRKVQNEQRAARKEERDISSGKLLTSQNEFAAIVASGPDQTPFSVKGHVPSGEGISKSMKGGKLTPLNASFTAYGTEKYASFGKKSVFEEIVEKNLSQARQQIVSRYEGLKGLKAQRSIDGKSKSQISSFSGFLFEDIIAGFLKGPEFDSYVSTAPDARFDFKPSQTLTDFFGLPGSLQGVEAKLNAGSNLMTSPTNASSMINKIYAVKGGFSLATPTFEQQQVFKQEQKQKLKKAAAGYIPNFSALQDAVSRERSAGIPSNKIYLASDRRLAAAGYNPGGLGVFNSIDEPTKASRTQAIKNRGYAKGYIPNFAEDTQVSDSSSTIQALVAQLGFLAFSFIGFNQQFKSGFEDYIGTLRTSVEKDKELLNTKDKNSKAAQKLEAKIQKNTERIAKYESIGQQGGIKGGARQLATKAGASSIGKSLGFPLAIGAPIIASTIANGINAAAERSGGATKEDRTNAAGVTALGNIASFTATGALFGPVGAAVGAVTGSLLSLNDYVEAANTDFPELAKAAEKSSSELTKFADSSSQFMSAYENYSKLISEGGDPSTVKKAEEGYARALQNLSTEDRNRLLSAAKLGKAQEEAAKILEEKNYQNESNQAAAETAKLVGSNITETSGRVNPFDSKFWTDSNILSSAVTGTRSSELDLNSNEIEQFKKQIQSMAFSGETGAKALERFNKIKPPKEFNSVDELKSYLEKAIPNKEGRDQLLKAAGDNPDSDAFRDITKVITEGISEYGKASKEVDEAGKESLKVNAARTKELLREQAALDKVVAAIQSNVRVSQVYIQSLDAMKLSAQKFKRDTAIADTFTRPSEALESIVGTDSKLGFKMGLKGSLVKNENERIGAVEDDISKFKSTVGTSLAESLQGVRDKVLAPPVKGEITDPNLVKQTGKELKERNNALVQADKEIRDALNNFTGENVDTNKLIKELRTSLEKAGIEDIESVLSNILISGAETNAAIDQTNQKFSQLQQNIAKDATQKLVIQAIKQGLNVFGGAESFLNPQRDQLDNVITPFKQIKDIIGQDTNFQAANQYRKALQDPNTPESTKGIIRELFKKEMDKSSLKGIGGLEKEGDTVEAGRRYLQLITKLQGFSGGAFTPDTNSTGYQMAVAGREEDLKNSVKDFEKALKDPKTPKEVKTQIRGFLDSLKNVPGGLRGAAEMQVGQATGTLNERTFQEIFKKASQSSIAQLQQISPEFGKLLEETFMPSGDKNADAVSLQTQIQTQSFGVLQNIDKTLVAIGNTSLTQAGELANLSQYSIPQLGTQVANKTKPSQGDSVESSNDSTGFTEPLISGINNAYTSTGNQTIDAISLQTRVAYSQLQVLSNIDIGISALASIVAENAGYDTQFSPVNKPKTPKNNKPVESNAKGYVPALNSELKAIQMGIGGSRGASPVYIPDLNGAPAFVNSSEKLVPNFGGSGETAVLTRDMQKAFGMAHGFIPNFAPLTEVEEFRKKFMSGRQMSMADYREQAKAYNKLSPMSKKWLQWQGSMDLADKMGTDIDKMRGNKPGTYSKWFRTPDAESSKGPIKLKDLVGNSSDKPVLDEIKKPTGAMSAASKKANISASSFARNELARELGIEPELVGPNKTPTGSSGALRGNALKPSGLLSSADEAAIAASQGLKTAGQEQLASMADDAVGSGSRKGVVEKLFPSLIKVGSADVGKATTGAMKGVGKATKTTGSLLSKTVSKVGGSLATGPRNYFNNIASEAGGIGGNAGNATPKGVYKTIVESLQSGGKMADVKMEDLKLLKPEQLKELFDLKLLDPKKFDLSKIGKFGGNLIKGAGTGIVTDLAGNYVKDKAMQAAGIDKNTYIGGVIDEISKSAIAGGSGATGGGLLGAIIGLGAETVGKVGRLATTTAELISVSNQNEVTEGARKKLDELARSEGFKDWNDREFGPNSWRGKRAQEAKAKRDKAGADQAAKTKSEQVAAEKARQEQIRKDNIAKGMTGPRAATKDDIDFFYKRGKYAPLGSKERIEYENSIKMGQMTANMQEARFGVPLDKKPSLFEDPLQKNMDQGGVNREKFNPTIKSEKIGLINGRPAIEWENEAKIQALDDKVKRGEMKKEEADKVIKEQFVIGDKFTADYRRRKATEDAAGERKTAFKKEMDQQREKLAKTDKFIAETDAAIMANKPSDQYLRDRGSFAKKPNKTGVAQNSSKPLASPVGLPSEGWAKSAAQELNWAYDNAIKSERNPEKALALAKKRQQIQSLYKTGKYSDLKKVYDSHEKKYERTAGTNPRTGNATNYAFGYIPALASLEESLSGEQAMLGYDKSIGLFMRNSGQPKNLDSIIAKDHPEGKVAAMRNSLKMQKQMGVMNKGYIPNFAESISEISKSMHSFTPSADTNNDMKQLISEFSTAVKALQESKNTSNMTTISPSVNADIKAPITLVQNVSSNQNPEDAIMSMLPAISEEISNNVKRAFGKKVPPTISKYRTK